MLTSPKLPEDLRTPRGSSVDSLLFAATERAELKEIVQKLSYDLAATEADRSAIAAERDALLSSSSWRITRPLRAVMNRLLDLRRKMSNLASPSRPRDLSVASATSSTIRPTPVGIPETDYDRWIRDHDTLSGYDRDKIKSRTKDIFPKPLFSFLVSIDGTKTSCDRLIRSLQDQIYDRWEIVFFGTDADAAKAEAWGQAVTSAGGTSRWVMLSDDRLATAFFPCAFKEAHGDFVLIAEPSGQWAPQALYEMAVALTSHPQVDIVYTDEDRIDARNHRLSPFFKPDWNIDLALAHNVIGRAAAFRRSTALSLCNQAAPIEDNHDLVLRFAAHDDASVIHHIPAILYHHPLDSSWCGERAPEESGATYAPSQAAVRRYLDRKGHASVQLVDVGQNGGIFRLRWPLPNPAPRVSIILPTRDRPDLVSRCIAGLLYRTDYPNFEVLVVDNDSREAETAGLFARLAESDQRVRILSHPGPFNYAALNNRAVAAATGEIILLLNNDVEVIESGWLRELVSHAIRPDVGAVGARLLYGDGSVQHAGVVLGVGTHAGGPGVAGHFGHGAAPDDVGYFGQLMLTREVSAVTGACLALRREVYLRAGGLDEINLPISFNDVDLCLRIRALGLRNLWTPFAELYHLESVSRGSDASPEQIARAAREAGYMRTRWGQVLDNDPFYNPNFDRRDHLFRLRHGSAPPRSWNQEGPLQ